ncbi:alpha/beta fold hydrolase [Streptomyces sp. NPDC127072]|uniref:alpha/beta hydrolase n=1 Tax=Streptomyces sp. NPDC127072 TaxID=3347129 RepID=UPI0036530D90
MAAPVDVRTGTPVHVVFVHGLYSNAAVWDRFRQLLAGDRQLQGVVAHCFGYKSRKVRGRPDRAIAEYDDIADSLATFLRVQIPQAGPVVLVTHSQGGLIVQRFLVRTLREARGRTLARIDNIVMFGCPNNGSDFLLTLRRLMFFARSPQERQLRPYQREVLETQRNVLRAVVQAGVNNESQWRIPIQAYGGTEDAVVPAREARGVFPEGSTVPGDHFQIVQPEGQDSASYRVVAAVLTAILSREVPSADGVDTTPPPSSVPPSSVPPSSVPPSSVPPTSVPLSSTPPPTPPPPPLSSTPPPSRPPDEPASLPPRLPGPMPAEAERPRLPQQKGGVSVSPPYGRRKTRLYGRAPRAIIARILGPAGPSEPRIHVLTGLGGSGKSRIALEAAFFAEQDRRVWWITVAQINASMREVASQLSAPSGEVEQAFRGDASPMDLVWRYLEASPEPWLLVIDNADTHHRLAPVAGQVTDGTGWVRQPKQADGIVVVTTRDRSAADWLPPCQVHPVPLLQADDGAELLLRAVPQGGSREEARRLSNALGGLPLALHGAASYLSSVYDASPSLDDPAIHDFADYQAAFEARGTSPAGTRASGLDEMLGTSAMAEVCDIALDLLSSQGLAQARPLLRVFACLGIAPIPYRKLLESTAIAESPLLPAFPRPQRNAVLKGLNDLGLVECSNGPETRNGRPGRTLTLHPVVHALLRADARMENRRTEYYGLIVDLLLDVTRLSPPDDPASWETWTAIAPHTMEVVRACIVGDSHVDSDEVLRGAVELARLTMRYLIAVGLLRPAQELSDTVLDNCAAIGFPPDSREILGVRHEHGRIALEGGDYERAETDLRRIVAAREVLLGPRDPDTLASRHKLARSILERGRFDEAEPLLRSIASAELSVNGPEHSHTVTVRHSLARAMFAQGRTVEAEKELREILQTSLGQWSPSTMETLRIRQTLSRCLLATERADEAADLIGRALVDSAHAQDSALAMTLRFTQCQVLLAQGRIRVAHTEAAHLLGDRKRVLGRKHPETLRTQKLLDAVGDLLDSPHQRPLD